MKFDGSIPEAAAEGLRSTLAGKPANLGIVEGLARVQRRDREPEQPGWLVWHYVFHNEVSFVSDAGRVESLTTSVADEHCEAEFARLVEEWRL